MDLHTWTNLTAERYATGLLVFARFGAMLFSAPLISGRGVPNRIRVGLAAALAMVVTPLLPATEVSSLVLLGALLAKETVVGLVLGWSASLFFSAAQMAGEWLDLQGGFQIGHMFNPALDVQTAPLGSAKMVMAGLCFVGAGGHTILLRATAASFVVCPPGTFALNAGQPGEWTGLLVRVMWLAVQIAAPVGVALFLTEVAVGIANRVLPQVNVMLLTLPLKAVLAVLALAVAVPVVTRVLGGAFGDLGAELQGVLRMLGA